MLYDEDFYGKVFPELIKRKIAGEPVEVEYDTDGFLYDYVLHGTECELAPWQWVRMRGSLTDMLTWGGRFVRVVEATAD